MIKAFDHSVAVKLMFFGVSLFVIAPLTIATSSAQLADAPIVMASTGHSTSISCIAISPDEHLIVTGGYDNFVKIWDLPTGRLLRTLEGHKSIVESVAVTLDGKRVASISADHTLRLWDAGSGRLLRTIAIDGQHGVAFTRDGSAILATTLAGVRRYNATTGDISRTYDPPKEFLYRALLSMALSPDERWIAAGYGSGDTEGGLIIIWDAGSGRIAKIFRGHSKAVLALAFSPDSRLIVSGSTDNTVKLWDVSGNQALTTFDSPVERGIFSVAFSKDGNSVAAYGDGKVKLYDVANGRLRWQVDGLKPVLFSPKIGNLLAGSQSGLNVIEAADGRILRSIGKNDVDAFTTTSVFTPAGKRLVLDAAGLSLWDHESGQLLKSYEEHAVRLSSITSTPKGEWLTVLMGYGPPDSRRNSSAIKIWDAKSEKTISSFVATNTEKDFIRTSPVSPDGRWVVSAGYYDKAVKFWDASTGQLSQTISPEAAGLSVENKSSYVFAMTFSPNGNELAIVSGPEKGIRLWDVATRTVRTKVGDYDERIVAYSPDGRFIITGYFQETSSVGDSVKLWDVQARRLLRTFKHGVNVDVLAFSPDGKYIVSSGGLDNGTNLFETATGKLELQFQRNAGSPNSIGFSPDGRQVVAANRNGTIVVWNVGTGRIITTTIRSASGEWVTITPEGFFASSEKGAELLYVVQGFETTNIDQVYQALYRPDLVSEKLAGDPKGLVREAAFQLDLTKVMASGVAPLARIVMPATGTTVPQEQVPAEIEITDRGGGIGRVEWRVNGVTVGVDEPKSSGGSGLTLRRSLALEDGANVIEIVAYNGRNLIASDPARINVKLEGAVKAAPRLYVLAIGISEYWDGRLRLNFPVADAKALAAGFREAGKDLYESVNVTMVLDAEAKKETIDGVFTALAGKVRPRDVFVFFVAGHGKTENGRYYFIPHDFRYENERSIAEKGISQEQLQAWFAKIPAKKSILLFDTCESGTLTGDRVATRGLELVASLERLTRAMGRTVLSASTDDAPALEGYEGHGVFTYALLDGIERANTDKNGYIDVTGLAAYVDAQVPEISQKAFNIRQVPQMKLLGSDFPLVRPTAVLTPASARTDPAIPRKPTHVVIQPADVFSEPLATTIVIKLAPGTIVTLVRLDQGWALIAKDGKSLGYVAMNNIAPMQ